MKRKYGWHHSLPDARDLRHEPKLGVAPSFVPSLTKTIPAYDQGQLGSCTGNGCARVDQYAHIAQGFQDKKTPSRLFIYYFARTDKKVDSGASVRNAFKVLRNQGAPDEIAWPYRIGKFAVEPTAYAKNLAIKRTVYEYAGIPMNVDAIRATLAQGYPIVFGFTVFDSFEGPKIAYDGLMAMPVKNERIVGGHCTVIDGYDDKSRNGDFNVVNSWGPAWGLNGSFKMPYDFLGYCSDGWIARGCMG